MNYHNVKPGMIFIDYDNSNLYCIVDYCKIKTENGWKNGYIFIDNKADEKYAMEANEFLKKYEYTGKKIDE